MKNMIYKHLKTCVLSLCVAVSCGDKAFGEPGVYFLCSSCSNEDYKEWVWAKDWIKHHQKAHGYTEESGAKLEEPRSFRCEQCRNEVTFPNLEELIAHLNTHEEDKKCGIKCLDCGKEFPWCFKDAHITYHKCYGKEGRIANFDESNLAFYCKDCGTHIRPESWNKHVNEEHRGDFSENIFICPSCEKYWHLKSGEEICCRDCQDKNSGVRCRKCNSISGKEFWNEHMHYSPHSNDFYGKFWYCSNCQELRYQKWEGIVCCQKCQHIYCRSHKKWCESGDRWNVHLKEEHTKDRDSVWFCHGCNTFMHGDRCDTFMYGNFCKKCRDAEINTGIKICRPYCFCQICQMGCPINNFQELEKHGKEKHSDVVPKEKVTWFCGYCKKELLKGSGIYCDKCKKQIWCRPCDKAIRPCQWNKHWREGGEKQREGGEKHKDGILSFFVCCGDIYLAKCGKSCLKCNLMYCLTCKKMIGRNGWNDHVNQVHNGDSSLTDYTCSECHRNMKPCNMKLQDRKGHMLEEHSEVYCEVCDEVVVKNKKQHLRGHMIGNHLDVYCDICDEIVVNDKTPHRRDHMIENHSDVYCEICNKVVTQDRKGHMKKEHLSVFLKEENAWLCLRCRSVLKKEEGNYCKNCKSQIWCQLCKKAIDTYRWNAHRKQEHKNDNSESVFVCCNEIYQGEWGKRCPKSDHMYCQPCKEMIGRKSWNAHVDNHKGTSWLTVYACSKCSENVKRLNMKDHMMEEHPDVSYCEYCNKVFEKDKTQDWWKDHMIENHSDVYCEICKEVVVNDTTPHMRDHMIKNHSDVYCEICKEVVEQDKLRGHKRNMHAGVYCEYCNKVVGNGKREEWWIGHMKKTHLDIFCEICNKAVGGSKEAKIQHYITTHKICRCGAKLLKKKGFGSLKDHDLKQHTLRCEICEKDFSIKEGLDHMKGEHFCNERCKPCLDYSSGFVVWKHDTSCKGHPNVKK